MIDAPLPPETNYHISNGRRKAIDSPSTQLSPITPRLARTPTIRNPFRSPPARASDIARSSPYRPSKSSCLNYTTGVVRSQMGAGSHQSSQRPIRSAPSTEKPTTFRGRRYLVGSPPSRASDRAICANRRWFSGPLCRAMPVSARGGLTLWQSIGQSPSTLSGVQPVRVRQN